MVFREIGKFMFVFGTGSAQYASELGRKICI